MATPTLPVAAPATATERCEGPQRHADGAPPPGTPTTPPATSTATPTATQWHRRGAGDRHDVGEPGESVLVQVGLVQGGDVAGTQNDIVVLSEARFAVTAGGRPDCVVNDAINKDAPSFSFQPPGCTPGADCTGIRAFVLALDNVDPIQVGAVLYSCRATIASTAADGVYPLRCSGAGASDPDGNALPTTCGDGQIVVDSLPIPTATPVASRADGERFRDSYRHARQRRRGRRCRRSPPPDGGSSTTSAASSFCTA